MLRAELLVKQVQRQTENERVGTNDGISLEEYYRYFNDAQLRLQRMILKVNNKAFRTFTTWSADGTEDYDLPFDYFTRNTTASLEYSESGNERDYYVLKKETQLERASYQGRPSKYILEGTRILVNAYPATGTFRLTYTKRLPLVDERRATVASRTLTTGVLSALALASYTDADYLLADHLCVVDFNGVIKARGIPYTGVTLGVVTIQGSTYTLPTGYTTVPVGDYVCLGAYSSTHFSVDDSAEDFLVAYCSRRILNRDGSPDAADLTADELTMIQDIVDIYADDADVDQVPVTDCEYFGDLD
jgi:hypothetical protein